MAFANSLGQVNLYELSAINTVYNESRYSSQAITMYIEQGYDLLSRTA